MQSPDGEERYRELLKELENDSLAEQVGKLLTDAQHRRESEGRPEEVKEED